jgi:hypothetical protein
MDATVRAADKMVTSCEWQGGGACDLTIDSISPTVVTARRPPTYYVLLLPKAFVGYIKTLRETRRSHGPQNVSL